tara:strand:+ start:679 stop:1233 length:555 start_codon:yes stop_codon:yes gene_type:complete
MYDNFSYICSVPIKMIFATDVGYGIGVNNNLPNWKLKGDLSRFKKLTIGKGNNFVIMGRNTWKSIGEKPFKNRHNIILSKTMRKNTNENEINIAEDITQAFQIIDNLKKPNSELWVIGGAQLYEDFIPYACEIHWTKAMNIYECSIYLSKEFIKSMITKIWSIEHIENESNESDSYIYSVWNNN